ncbi:DoxX family protein [Lutibacter citreus]|uniref:DoxX family protein n=1 Tax=Lutibacter citreus TaxID=2138210 RepID=UPI000DBEA21B|nr:DoxX family protein [Lutibacter citreus]
MSIIKNHTAEILIVIFFIITYLFSVLEKLADWKGTVAYYTIHFSKTILQKIIPILLINIVVFEIATVFLLTLGLYYLVTQNDLLIAKVGLEISAITLLQFLVGQRIAKDYPGAMNITVYFMLNIIGIYLLT